MKAHVHVPGEDVIGQALDDVQLFVGFLAKEASVHLLPAMPLPLGLLVVDHTHRLPNLLQVAQLVATPGDRFEGCR